jgi:hypothetical protein
MQKTKIVLLFHIFSLLIISEAMAQCNNFSNSIVLPTLGTINNCNATPPAATAHICADFNVAFSNGNASFYWGYTVNGVKTQFGPINTSQSSQFPNIVCVDIPCGSTISFFVTSYSNPNGGGSQCNGANATFTTPLYSSLPVELTYFKVVDTKSDIKLEWSTASETNNDYFDLQYSYDDINWVTKKQIKGHGTSRSVLYYEYILDDADKIYDTNWRLIQYDYDGKSQSSPVVFSRGIKQSTELSIFPNPADQYLIVRGIENSENAPEAAIYDVMGHAVVKVSKDRLLDGIALSDLKAGMYVIEIWSDGVKHTKRFQKI